MCILLSITTLVISDLVEEEETAETDGLGPDLGSKSKIHGGLRQYLVLSLQNLLDYKSLLAPPQSVVDFANRAATKAMMIVSGVNVGNPSYLERVIFNISVLL